MNERIKELSSLAKNLTTDEAIHLSRIHNRTLSLDEEQEIFAEKFAEVIGRDMLKLANRHGNIKNHSINEYFGFEKDFGINTNNIKRFVNERTN